MQQICRIFFPGLNFNWSLKILFRRVIFCLVLRMKSERHYRALGDPENRQIVNHMKFKFSHIFIRWRNLSFWVEHFPLLWNQFGVSFLMRLLDQLLLCWICLRVHNKWSKLLSLEDTQTKHRRERIDYMYKYNLNLR